MPDLLHDLEVHGTTIRLRYCEHIVHINIHSMHDGLTTCKSPKEESRLKPFPRHDFALRQSSRRSATD
jgi:hypothetical protein